MNHILNHMGHTWEVHQAYYREYSSVIERLDVAKVLLMQDTDQVAENRKKKISEINVSKLRDTPFSGESLSSFFFCYCLFCSNIWNILCNANDHNASDTLYGSNVLL